MARLLIVVVWLAALLTQCAGDYTISATTGVVDLADTMAKVIYRLVGTTGDSGEVTLDNGYITSGETYTWTHSGDLGDITKIYLTHDNQLRFKGFIPVGPGWYVTEVVITDTLRGTEYQATVDCWLIDGEAPLNCDPVNPWYYEFVSDEVTTEAIVPQPATTESTPVVLTPAPEPAITQAPVQNTDITEPMAGTPGFAAVTEPQDITEGSSEVTDPHIPSSGPPAPELPTENPFDTSRAASDTSDVTMNSAVSQENPDQATASGEESQSGTTTMLPPVITQGDSHLPTGPAMQPTGTEYVPGFPLPPGFPPVGDFTFPPIELPPGGIFSLPPNPADVLFAEIMGSLTSHNDTTDLTSTLATIDGIVTTIVNQGLLSLDQMVEVAEVALEVQDRVLTAIQENNVPVNAELSDILDTMDGISHMLSVGLTQSNATSVVVTSASLSVGAVQLNPPGDVAADPNLLAAGNFTVDVVGVLDLAGIDPEDIPATEVLNLVVIPEPSIFLPEGTEINMPIVSVNIRDTASPNATNDDAMSFVTTLSNVNQDPPKENIKYCVNTTELFVLNFAYQVGSRESAFRFDLMYPSMDIFHKVSLRYGAKPSEHIQDLHLAGDPLDIQSQLSGNLELYWDKTDDTKVEIFVYENQMETDSTLYMKLEFQNTTESQAEFCVAALAIEPRALVDGIWIPSDDTHVVEVSTYEDVVFESSVFGAISCNLYIPPNTIDFGRVFSQFDVLLQDSPVVFAVVITIAVSLICSLVAAYLLDRKDVKLMHPYPVIGSGGLGMAKEGLEYTFLVVTGWKGKRRNTSNVYMRLTGTKDVSPVIPLDDGQRQHFRRGTASAFKVWLPCPLGSLEALEIWHDNGGENPHWFLDKVLVKETDQDQSWSFVCKSWLSVREDDGRVRRRFPELNQDPRYNIYIRDLSIGVFRRHLVGAVFNKHSRSKYTCAQRVGILYMMFFLIMVSNAMWYGAEERAETNFTIKLGAMSIGWPEFYVGIMTVVTVYPATLLVVEVFRRRKDPDLAEMWLRNKPREERWLVSEDVDSGRLPRWTCWLAWAIVFGAIAASGFFVILYSLDWGGEKANRWLGSYVLSFVEILLLMDPFVLFIIYIITKRIHSSSEKSTGKYDAEMAEPELDEETRRLHAEQVVHGRMMSTCTDIVFYLLYLFLLMGISDSVGGKLSFLQTQNVKDLLPPTNVMPTYGQFFIWLDGMKETLYETKNYRGEPPPITDVMFVNLVHYRAMPLQVRQVRVKPANCDLYINYRYPTLTHNDECLPPYSSDDEESRDFRSTWIPFNNRTAGDTVEAYDYDGTPSSEFWGILSNYPSSGYTQSFGHSHSKADGALEELFKSRWVDSRTRALLVDCVFFNAYTNLFTIVKFVFEVPACGGLVEFRDIDSLRLYTYVGEAGLVLLVMQLLWLLIFVISTVREVRKILREKKAYFNSGWNCLKLANVLVVIGALVAFVLKSIYIQLTVEQVKNNIGGVMSFDMVLLFGRAYSFCMGVACFLAIILMLNMLSLNKYIAILSSTMKLCWDAVVSCGVIIIAFTFANLGLFHVVYGPYHAQFSGLANSASTMLTVALGQLSYYDILDGTSDPFSRLMFGLYMLVMAFLLINMFIAIVMDTYEEITDDDSKYTYDRELVEHIWQKMMTIWHKTTSIGQASWNVRDTLPQPVSPTHSETIEDLHSQWNAADEKMEKSLAIVKQIFGGETEVKADEVKLSSAMW